MRPEGIRPRAIAALLVLAAASGCQDKQHSVVGPEPGPPGPTYR